MKNACRLSVLVLLMTLGASGTLFAQSDLGRISGFIKDPSGATIANARVTVRNNAAVERQTTTNESGYYVITNVPIGPYTVDVNLSGFQRKQQTGINVVGVPYSGGAPAIVDLLANMPFMDEDPKAKLSSTTAKFTYGPLLRYFRTQSINKVYDKEPEWRHPRAELTSGYTPRW